MMKKAFLKLRPEDIALGDLIPPDNGAGVDLFTCGVSFFSHGNAIECYGLTADDATFLAEQVLQALRQHVALSDEGDLS